MSEVNYFKIADLPVIDSVPEGATVLAYNAGQLMRVNGENVGGGGTVVTIKMDGYDDAVAGIAPAAAQAPTFTCDTAYDEIVQMILGGKNFSIKLCAYQEGALAIETLTAVVYAYAESVPFITANSTIFGAALYISADGVSTEIPGGK